MTDHFADKHVLITGGSSGIGKACAKAAYARGARISIVARRQDVLDMAAKEIGDGVFAVSADVTDREQLGPALAAAVGEHGVPDVVICSAGIATARFFLDTPEGEYDQMMRVNYFGTLATVRALLPDMLARGSGQLVLVSSGAALIGLPGYSAYGPSKFAVRGLGESLYCELGPAGIGVSVAYLPDVDTPQLEAENRTKPPELAAISGAAKVWSAEHAADVILAGVARRRFVVTGGSTITALAWLHSVLGPVLRRSFSNALRKAK